MEEGFGLSAAEALAVEVPVVGYASGALPEVLGDAALLVPTGDTDALASAIVRDSRTPEYGVISASRPQPHRRALTFCSFIGSYRELLTQVAMGATL